MYENVIFDLARYMGSDGTVEDLLSVCEGIKTGRLVNSKVSICKIQYVMFLVCHVFAISCF